MSNENTLSATDSELLKMASGSLVFNTLLKLSGLGGIRGHIKAIRIIMEKFQRQSQRPSRYTVHNIDRGRAGSVGFVDDNSLIE